MVVDRSGELVSGYEPTRYELPVDNPLHLTDDAWTSTMWTNGHMAFHGASTYIVWTECEACFLEPAGPRQEGHPMIYMYTYMESDEDEDGVPDECDICPFQYNPDQIQGDLNGDGVVDKTDAEMMLECLGQEVEDPEDDCFCADLTGDGEVTAEDFAQQCFQAGRGKGVLEKEVGVEVNGVGGLVYHVFEAGGEHFFAQFAAQDLVAGFGKFKDCFHELVSSNGCWPLPSCFPHKREG